MPAPSCHSALTVCVLRGRSQWLCLGLQLGYALKRQTSTSKGFGAVDATSATTACIFVYFVARFVIVPLVLKEYRHHSLFSVALFDSLHYTADSNLLRSFAKPPTANSHLTIDERSDSPELFRCSQPIFSPDRTGSPPALMGKMASECL